MSDHGKYSFPIQRHGILGKDVREAAYFFQTSFTSLPIGKFPWLVFWWWGWVVVGGNGIAGNPSQASLSIQLLPPLIIILQPPCPNHLLADIDNISKLVLDFCLYLHLTIAGPGCSTIKTAWFHLFPKM